MTSKLAYAALALCFLAVSAPGRACNNANPPRAIQLQGTITEGGTPGAFTKIIDLRHGRSVTTETQGVHMEMHGFDGMPWYATNGTVVRADAPPYVANAIADAFVDRLAWTTGAHLPTVHVRSGSHGVVDTITIDTDQGSRTVALGDWRCVAGFDYPFEQTTTGAAGDTSIVKVRSVKRVVATTATFAPPAPQSHGVLDGPTPVEVPFTFTGPHDPHILVNASVDGHDAKLIFDTGADSYFGPQSAKTWGLGVSGGTDIGGAGAGSVSGGYVRFKSLRIGGAELRDQYADVAPLPWPNTPAFPDGLTGFQFFVEFRTTIDYQDRILRFESFDAPPSVADAAAVPFSTDGDGHMYATASVNGVQGLFLIDTGDNIAITLFPTFAQRAGVAGLDAATDTTGGAVGGAVSLASVSLGSFALAGNTLNSVHAKVAKMRTGFFASKGIAGNLGGGLFRCFALTIDYRSRTLVFAKQADTAACLAGV